MNQRYNKQLELARYCEQLMGTPEWGFIVQEMEKEIQRLTQLTEESGFVREAAKDPIVLADNLSFRRGIRYVIDFPVRAVSAGRIAAEKLQQETRETQD